MKYCTYILLLFVGLFISCATVFYGKEQPMRITSYPSDAAVYINDEFVGHTPLKRLLKRTGEYIITIELEGYLPYEIKLEKKKNSLRWANLWLSTGIPLGFLIDKTTGGMYSFTPDQVNGILDKELSQKDQGGAVILKVVMKVDPSLKKIGQLTKAQ